MAPASSNGDAELRSGGRLIGTQSSRLFENPNSTSALFIAASSRRSVTNNATNQVIANNNAVTTRPANAFFANDFGQNQLRTEIICSSWNTSESGLIFGELVLRDRPCD